MQVVIDDFNQRKIEIDKYFEFVEKIEDGYIILNSLNTALIHYKIDEEHIKIFKANGFLILYNLVESTILNCIISIFDEISTKEINNSKISYRDVNEKIKKYWLKNKYNHDEKIKKVSVVNQFYQICENVTANISLSIVSEKVSFGGNLNAMRIREIAEDLGIALDESHYKAHLHGAALKEIKKNRNDLAHGHKSFTTIGKDITYIGDGLDGTKGLGLKHLKDYTIEHLESFIKNIKQYIIEEKYLIENQI
jgi:hypothetical protein